MSAIIKAVLFVWHWSVPYRSSNRPIDKRYASVWRTPIDDKSIRSVFQRAFGLSDAEVSGLSTDEEEIRFWLQERSNSSKHESDKDSTSGSEGSTNQAMENTAIEGPEEASPLVPEEVRRLLASMNAHHIEQKLELLTSSAFHTRSGSGSLRRSRNGINKTFHMWRLGFVKGVSRLEQVAVILFFIFLVFSACYPDVAAGFLGERSYNQRSIGSRIVTLCQLFSLFTFEFHSLWLLFNWSLERLLGAFVGNTVYALAAVIPALHRIYQEKSQTFRFALLAASLSWQIGVQFSPAVRDYVVRLINRRQMTRMRASGDTESITWQEVDEEIQWELLPARAYAQRLRAGNEKRSWQSIPFRVRVERYIHFTKSFSLGRPSDQLVGLLKEDLECVINTYEDYSLSTPQLATYDKGYAEPRLPKLLLVFFDVGIFMYITYSFWTQPFTFNTTVAYGTVVCIKQLILALKRYQTAKSARRLFTNMVSINIIGIFLVSTPVTVNRHVLESTGAFVGLTLAMVFATLFLAEPIAPLILAVTEKIVAVSSKLVSKLNGPGKTKRDERRLDQVTITDAKK